MAPWILIAAKCYAAIGLLQGFWMIFYTNKKLNVSIIYISKLKLTLFSLKTFF
jgi:hypothetical protein